MDAIGLMRTGGCVRVDAIWRLRVWSITGQMVANRQLRSCGYDPAVVDQINANRQLRPCGYDPGLVDQIIANRQLRSCGYDPAVAGRMVPGRTSLSCFRRDQMRFFNSEAPGWQGRQGPAPEWGSGVDPVVQRFQKGCKGCCGMRPAYRTGSAKYSHRVRTDPYFRYVEQTHKHIRCRSCSHFLHPIHRSFCPSSDYLTPHDRWWQSYRSCRKCPDNSQRPAAAAPRRPSDSRRQADGPQVVSSAQPVILQGRPAEEKCCMTSGVISKD